MAQPLTRRELDVLAFEHHRFSVPGAKGTAIGQLFPEWSETRYYQALNALIDRPEAEAHAPALIRRLRALRERRPRHGPGSRRPAGVEASLSVV